MAFLIFSNKGPTNPQLPDIKFLTPTQPLSQLQRQQEEQLRQQQLQQQQLIQQQSQQNVQGASESAKASSIVIKTSKGDITIKFYANDAKNTVANFVNKAKSGFYNNLTFHRVEDWVVQGGDPLGNGTGGGNMQTELNDHPFVRGSVGVARGNDIKISNDAQFFITKQDASHLNGQYTNFGEVTSGMDVVDKIEIGDKILGLTIE
ncbi:MAG: peptidylprolyl isomerase [Candidatus Levybacteria bacterium]|nr:peptidylprolyl isomerase [Candidatus Levybacteria bacterium]